MCTDKPPELLIDGDFLIYKAGCSNETREYRIQDKDTGIVVHSCQYKAEADAFIGDDPELEAVKYKEAGPLSYSLANAKMSIEKVLDSVPHAKYRLFIGGEGNFRKDLYPRYKGNRSSDDRPIHEFQIRDYLISRWGAEVVHGEEADDKVSYIQCSDLERYCIVGVDKDLWNTPGWHYNPDKDIMEYLVQEDADYNFWTQMITGDTSDNIPGIKGAGAKRAQKVLDCEPQKWYNAVLNEYTSKHDDMYFILMGRLIWMRRKPNQMWTPEVMNESI